MGRQIGRSYRDKGRAEYADSVEFVRRVVGHTDNRYGQELTSSFASERDRREFRKKESQNASLELRRLPLQVIGPDKVQTHCPEHHRNALIVLDYMVSGDAGPLEAPH